jgi:hypothetical protein
MATAQLSPALAQQQLVETLIAVTRLSSLHRAIVGGDGLELCTALHDRGFLRATTTATCPVARGQHSVGIIARHHSRQALEAAIADISHYLSTTAAIAVLIDCSETGCSLRVRSMLEQLGFRIEAGVRCQQGFVLSARRQNASHMARAA